MALEVPATLSPSKMTAFTECALAFRFSVIDRVPEPPSAPAAKGTVVHRALELLFEEPPERRTLDVALGHLATAHDEVLATDEYAELELDEAGAAAFRTESERHLRAYFELEDPSRVEPVGLELQLEADVGGLRLRGILDRLERDAAGRLVVTDYKTGRAPGVRFERRRLGGVHFYALLCEQVLGERPASVQLLYLRDPVAIVTEPSDQSIRGLRRKLGAVWAAVERACADEDFRPNPSGRCDWCAFRPWCPAWGGDPAAAPRAGQPGALDAVRAAAG